MKFAPQELWMKQGGRLLLREAQGTDAGAVLAYLNRVGGESDNLLFGKDGFPLPVEREAAFLERQRQEERSLRSIRLHSAGANEAASSGSHAPDWYR